MAYPTTFPTPASGKKWVSIFIGNVDDELVSLTVGTSTYTNTPVSSLVSSNPSIFQFYQNPNGQTDLGFQISDSIAVSIGSFKEVTTLAPYNAQTNDAEYIGGQRKPKPRCPACL